MPMMVMCQSYDYKRDGTGWKKCMKTYKQRCDEEKREAQKRKKLKLADIAEARAREE